MNTELLYMTDGDLATYTTTVQEVQGKTGIILPATIFYPQGGGQPYDQGVIRGENGVFQVNEVRNVDGVVVHLGILEGEMVAGDEVVCEIDTARRLLNTRVHSGAHLLDLAVHTVGLHWVPGKGYSFPDGPYVEYTGDFTALDLQATKNQIDAACAEVISQDLPVRIEFMNRVEMEKRLPFVPTYLPENRPARVVFMGEYGIPCGGTHVHSLKEIGAVSVRKMKISGDVLRVSYQISE